jgi:hypothetical protein
MLQHLEKELFIKFRFKKFRDRLTYYYCVLPSAVRSLEQLLNAIMNLQIAEKQAIYCPV